MFEAREAPWQDFRTSTRVAFGGSATAAPEGRAEHSRAAKPPDCSPKIIRSPGGAARSRLAPAGPSRSRARVAERTLSTVTSTDAVRLSQLRAFKRVFSNRGRQRVRVGIVSALRACPDDLGGRSVGFRDGYAPLGPSGLEIEIHCRRPNDRRRCTSADFGGLTRAVGACLISDARLLPNLNITG
jgi:hypothetical protein